MNYSLRQLRIFVTVAQAKSFSRAGDIIGLSQSAVSHQLRVLKDAELVTRRRDGKTIYYSLADEHVRAIIEMGFEHITEE